MSAFATRAAGHENGSPTLHALFVEAGRRGARKRWGEQRIVRLDGLSETDRRDVIALVERLRQFRGDKTAD